MLKKICPRCQGNGYIKVKQSVDNPVDEILQCPLCNSEGELMIDQERINSITTQRLMLESKLVKELNGVIKKLNDEVDMLTKQKVYLQSKLREKEKTDDQGR